MICKNCFNDKLNFKPNNEICETCVRKLQKIYTKCRRCKILKEKKNFSEKWLCNQCVEIKHFESKSCDKTCYSCGILKDKNKFYKDRTVCYDCINKDRYSKIKIGIKKKYPNSKEKREEWLSNNKERIKEYRKAYSKYKYHNDAEYKLKIICRSFLNRCFYSKNGKRTQEVLRYSTNQLKQRLECQFTKEMSWNNYGSYWNIDHRKPISLFRHDSPVYLINMLSNLKPVIKEFNYSKQNKIIK